MVVLTHMDGYAKTKTLIAELNCTKGKCMALVCFFACHAVLGKLIKKMCFKIRTKNTIILLLCFL